MSNDKKRQRFIELLEQLQALESERLGVVALAVMNRFSEVMLEFMTPFYLEKFPRRRKVTMKALKVEMGEELRAAEEGFERGLQYRCWEAEHGIKATKEEMSRLGAVPKGGDKRLCYHWVYPNFTQGLGQDHYDRKTAERYKLHAEQNGIEAEIEVTQTGAKRRYNSYKVFVFVEHPADLEMLRLAPGMTMREFVKWAWGNGVNPRVYHPFLPHGFEEQNGLDFFGNEVGG